MDFDLVKELLPKSVQYHRTRYTEHQMQLEGIALRENKEKTIVMDENREELGIEVLVHQRWIDERSFTVLEMTVSEEVVVHKVQTEMSDGEIRAFEEEWSEKWRPKVTNDEIAEIARNLPEQVNGQFGEAVTTSSGRQFFIVPPPTVESLTGSEDEAAMQKQDDSKDDQ